MITVEWLDGKIRYLDQTRLPSEEVYVETDQIPVLAEAIRSLRIRGAPAIGVAAAFGMLLAVDGRTFAGLDDLRSTIESTAAILESTRPTAVNLFAAVDRMRRVAGDPSSAGPAELLMRLRIEAMLIYREDVESCRRIGEIGAALLKPGSTVLTHCNAGALATAGEGTALAVITTAARQGKIERVYVDETRPLFQGARLTAWELVKSGIEAVLITDSTAGSVIQSGRVQAIIVGADRIAANGDAANKIGTYPLAVLAAAHRVPFYVAAPTSTIDIALPDGRGIPIEERRPEEVTHVGGVRIAAEGVRVYAPAFDVTPAALITGIITERGLLTAPFPASIASTIASLRR
jgi:methylthioribose-1-phosphate isomerase